jgi:hypothetical protein
MASAWKICAEMGITLVSKRNFRSGDLEPKQTRSRAAIKELAETGEETGYPELIYDVLGLFLASETNQRQLYGENLHGVARWLIAARLRTADIPFVSPAFSRIDMGAVRGAVLHYNIPMRAPQIAFMLAGLMEPALEQINVIQGRKSA